MASVSLEQGRITRERYWRLVEEGVIGPDDRVELLEGVIVAMSPQDPPRASVISHLTAWLSGVVGDAATVRVQLPLDLSQMSTPEPDIAVVQHSPDHYATHHPTTALLVIEVADSSVIQDRLTKGPMYAAAGVEEYWLVNLRARCVEVQRKPLIAERRYAESAIVAADGKLTVSALPTASIPVCDILPPPSAPAR